MSARRIVQPGDEVEQRRLAGAGAATDGDELSLAHHQVHMPKRHDIAAPGVVSLDEVTYKQHGISRRHHVARRHCGPGLKTRTICILQAYPVHSVFSAIRLHLAARPIPTGRSAAKQRPLTYYNARTAYLS